MTPTNPATEANAPTSAQPGRWRKPTVSFLILCLVLGALLPIFGIVAMLFTELRQDLNTDAVRQAESLAQSEATIVDGQLHDMAVTLQLIASSPELASGDLKAFYNRTKAALVGSSWFLLLVDDTGHLLLNSRLPFGAALGKTADVAAFKRAMSARTLLISNAFFGRVAGRWVFNVVLPLPAGSIKHGAALILTQNLEAINARIGAQALPPGWTSVLVDNANRVLASSNALPVGSDLRTPFLVDKKSTGMSRSQGGLIVASAPVPEAAGWRVLIWGPSAVASSPVLWSWGHLLLAGGLLLVVSLTFAVLTGRMIHGAISATSEMAVRMGKGEVVSVPRLPFREAQMIALAIREASASRRKAEAQLSVALRELAHRLKNLIMVMQGIVRQTGRHTQDVIEFRRLLSDRLHGLSNSIDLLIEHHHKEGIPVEELVRAQLSSFLVDWECITLVGSPIMVREEAVQALGMILHELATNATKYGALSRPEGSIEISWSENPRADFALLVWKETGVAGCAESVRGFGVELIEGTASMLGGSAILETRDGELIWRLKLKRSALTGQA